MMLRNTNGNIFFPVRGIFLLVVVLLAACQPDPAEKVVGRTEIIIGTPDELFSLFEEKNYTSEAWQAGIRDVPRIYITQISTRWQDTSQKIPVITKKRIFFRLVAPLALAGNEDILADRKKLLETAVNSAKDQKWLVPLARKYKLDVSNEAVTQQQFEELIKRVDIIPVSLVLAQSAEESGWGTSRFAVHGNALFGQWDFSGKGIKPKEQRKELGNYGIAQFDSPIESVAAYMLNLNTHAAYARLRESRAALRVENKPVSGFILAQTLDKYSERGMDYVHSLHTMMRVNNLSQADDAVLVGDEEIYLVLKSLAGPFN
jgi:Bax protein